MNLIEKLGLEKCKAIVDGAPEGVRYYCADYKGDWEMKANLNDATHYNERTDEYWLLEKRIKKELNVMEPDDDEFPLYRAGFHEALNKALTKIDEVLK